MPEGQRGRGASPAAVILSPDLRRPLPNPPPRGKGEVCSGARHRLHGVLGFGASRPSTTTASTRSSKKHTNPPIFTDSAVVK